MKITIVTLFKDMFNGFLEESIIKRAIDKGIVKFNLVDFREYSLDKHHHVDDTPYGGGAGMVLKCDVIDRCLEDIKTNKSKIILMTPQGTKYNQAKAYELAKEEDIILVCGHYEGFDERIRSFVDEEISVGDFVLTGGEIPAMLISDSITRLLGGAITEESHMGDSYSNGLLEYPQYTRPATYKGMDVPSVLQNGNHKEIAKWRIKESIRKTYLRRPDLLKNYEFSKEDKKLYQEVIEEEKNNND